MKFVYLCIFLISLNPSHGCLVQFMRWIFPEPQSNLTSSTESSPAASPQQQQKPWTSPSSMFVKSAPMSPSTVTQKRADAVTDSSKTATTAPVFDFPSSVIDLSILHIPLLDGLLKPFNDVLAQIERQAQNDLQVLSQLDQNLYNNFVDALKDLQQVLTTANVTSPGGLANLLDALSKVLNSMIQIMDSALKMNIPADKVPLFQQTRDTLSNLMATINTFDPVLKMIG